MKTQIIFSDANGNPQGLNSILLVKENGIEKEVIGRVAPRLGEAIFKHGFIFTNPGNNSDKDLAVTASAVLICKERNKLNEVEWPGEKPKSVSQVFTTK